MKLLVSFKHIFYGQDVLFTDNEFTAGVIDSNAIANTIQILSPHGRSDLFHPLNSPYLWQGSTRSKPTHLSGEFFLSFLLRQAGFEWHDLFQAYQTNHIPFSSEELTCGPYTKNTCQKPNLQTKRSSPKGEESQHCTSFFCCRTP